MNAVLKSGTDRFQWDAEVLGGTYVYPGTQNRAMDFSFNPPFAQQNYQLNVSGPVGLPKTNFLLSGRHYRFGSPIVAERVFNPSDSSDFQNDVFVGSGDLEERPLGYSHEYSDLPRQRSRNRTRFRRDRSPPSARR